ncbi:hypothetical protein MPER_09128 [Moniliophthora perniciosa FA553]|nr:hypothetical protein MPER_09128 [Moniliophthora perniciosa FA553]
MTIPSSECWRLTPAKCSIEDNTVAATAFKAISAPRLNGEREENETEKGLRVSDKGFLNTAVLRSEITYIDGEAGGYST